MRAALQESSSCCAPASQLQMDYTMDQLWNDITAAEADTSYDATAVAMASPPSPVWEFRGGVRGPRCRRWPAAAAAATAGNLLLFRREMGKGEERGWRKRMELTCGSHIRVTAMDGKCDGSGMGPISQSSSGT
uniref:Uncharacterized protein n=1 Tax=Oryza barthii TaxID=65489 RepID=A0A0D3HE61_9ORYZ